VRARGARDDIAERVVERYRREFGKKAHVLIGSSREQNLKG